MLVSIIVPVYNTRAYLKKCINSLAQQTYKQIEILLVDDGSEKMTSALCDELAETDLRIKVIHKENGGLVSAWKSGTQNSKGKYLMYVDSDDWVEQEMISEMVEMLQGDCREIISSDYVISRDNGLETAVFQRLAPGVYGREQIEKQVIPKLLGYEHRFVTMSRCMKLISRELVEDNMFYSDERIRMGEDVTIMLPALLDCERLVVMDHKIYYHYFLLEDSMAHKYDNGLYKNICLVHDTIKYILQDKFADKPQVLQKMLYKADQEHIMMLLLVLKNEARGNPAEYQRNIRSICLASDVMKLIKETDVEIHEKANQLLYHCMKHPNVCSLFVLRMAMKIYYRS